MRRREALAQDEDLVCKARVRICLYERFPRFQRFVLILRQPCSKASRWAQGFGIKGVADHIKAGDISSAPYPAGYEPASKLRCVCST